jgi:HEAT repeat protein
MGLFDFFRKSPGGPAEQERTLARHVERVMDKRSLSPDRFASIEYLSKLGTDDAWRALLPRLNFTVDPSITDREEKQYIFDAVTRGGESAVEPVKEFLRKTTAVNWPIKMLRELLSAEDFAAELIDILKGEDTVYQKNPERKIQTIIALEKDKDPRVAAAVAPFLEDASEDTRFHAVRTLLAQEDAAAAPALCALLARDDSMRLRTTVVDGLASLRWAVPDEHREKVTTVLARLPNGPFSLGADGVIARSGR